MRRHVRQFALGSLVALGAACAPGPASEAPPSANGHPGWRDHHRSVPDIAPYDPRSPSGSAQQPSAEYEVDSTVLALTAKERAELEKKLEKAYQDAKAAAIKRAVPKDIPSFFKDAIAIAELMNEIASGGLPVVFEKVFKLMNIGGTSSKSAEQVKLDAILKAIDAAAGEQEHRQAARDHRDILALSRTALQLANREVVGNRLVERMSFADANSLLAVNLAENDVMFERRKKGTNGVYVYDWRVGMSVLMKTIGQRLPIYPAMDPAFRKKPEFAAEFIDMMGYMDRHIDRIESRLWCGHRNAEKWKQTSSGAWVGERGTMSVFCKDDSSELQLTYQYPSWNADLGYCSRICQSPTFCPEFKGNVTRCRNAQSADRSSAEAQVPLHKSRVFNDLRDAIKIEDMYELRNKLWELSDPNNRPS
jgi:hypothetical protein